MVIKIFTIHTFSLISGNMIMISELARFFPTIWFWYGGR